MHRQIDHLSQRLRFCISLLAVAMLFSSVVEVASAGPRAPRHVPASSAFGLPAATKCVKHSQLSIHIKRVRGVRWVGGVVKVNGERFDGIGQSEMTQPLELTGLPDGRIVVSVTIRGAGGLSVSISRTYLDCAAPATPPAKKPPSTPKKPVNPKPPVTPPSTSPPAGLESGTYTGSFGSLYVSADSIHLQDVVFSTVHLNCAPGGNRTDRIDIGEVGLKTDGSFNSVTTQDGVLDNVPAKFTYAFNGIASGTGISGTAREDVSYVKGGVTYSCTSGTWSWAMTRERQGSQAGPAPSGSYTGSFGSLYVPTDSTQLQDVVFSTFHLACTPGGNPTDRIDIGEVAIEPDGSFDSVTTQHGVLGGAEATFTYTFSGHLHGYSSSGVARIAGMVREDVTYVKGGVTYSCSSNNWSWAMNRENQGSQAGPPPSGAYAGSFGSLQVAPGSSRLVAVSFPTFHLGCAPAGTPTSHFDISEVALEPDGSFSTVVTTTEPISGGVTATITYTFSGHFHGYTSSGVARIAGMAREDMTYTQGGTTYSCSSNNWSWSMAHA